MTEIEEVSVRKRRSRQEIKRLVTEFEISGLWRSEFCHKHNLASQNNFSFKSLVSHWLCVMERGSDRPLCEQQTKTRIIPIPMSYAGFSGSAKRSGIYE